MLSVDNDLPKRNSIGANSRQRLVFMLIYQFAKNVMHCSQEVHAVLLSANQINGKVLRGSFYLHFSPLGSINLFLWSIAKYHNSGLDECN